MLNISSADINLLSAGLLLAHTQILVNVEYG